MAAEKKAKEREKAERIERQKEETARMALFKGSKGGYGKSGSWKHQEVQTRMTLTKEPFASLANQLELASPGGKLLLPIQSRRDSEEVSPAASP